MYVRMYLCVCVNRNNVLVLILTVLYRKDMVSGRRSNEQESRVESSMAPNQQDIHVHLKVNTSTGNLISFGDTVTVVVVVLIPLVLWKSKIDEDFVTNIESENIALKNR